MNSFNYFNYMKLNGKTPLISAAAEIKVIPEDKEQQIKTI